VLWPEHTAFNIENLAIQPFRLRVAPFLAQREGQEKDCTQCDMVLRPENTTLNFEQLALELL